VGYLVKPLVLLTGWKGARQEADIAPLTFCWARSATRCLSFGGIILFPFGICPPFFRPPDVALALSFPDPCAMLDM
jgi:hypothetical protein